mmetsp:Transcript_39292/g.63321  ORF Transcript_39292/g.63321 Transcript_39292/m.63321 type:complete len:239 (-) Transcript_39292:687-1403(-)
MSCQQSTAGTPPFYDGGWSPARKSSGEGSASNDNSSNEQAVTALHDQEVAESDGHESLVAVSLQRHVSLSYQAVRYCLGDPCLTYKDCDKINIVNLELTTTVNLGLARPTISDQPNENGLLGFESLEIIQPLEFFRRFSEISSLCPHWRHTPCDDLPICLQEVFALCGIKSRPGAKNMFDYSRILTKQKHKSVTSSWNLMHSDNENEKNSKKRACDIVASSKNKSGYFGYLMAKRQRS